VHANYYRGGDMNHQEWETPWDFYNVVNDEFGFDIDVAATLNNRKCVRCITPEMDGLLTEWTLNGAQAAWCNPGFGDMERWVWRAAEQLREGLRVACVLGPLSRAKWFEHAVDFAAEIRILTPRIQFIAPSGVTSSTNRTDNVLCVFRSLPQNHNPAHIWLWRWA